jgi:hypothetical protein
MKAAFLIVFLSAAVSSAFAQEPADALRYSYTTQPGGTARNQAIGGAGGSLGGEFTSLFINPAGLGFYKTGDFVITPEIFTKNTKSYYLNSSESAAKSSFSLGTSGFILSGTTRSQSIKSFSIGFGINRVADFNNHVYYRGKNTNSSFSEKYLEELVNDNVTNPNDAANNYPYGSSLAFNTYLIDTTQDANGSTTGYQTRANPATGLIQENTITTSGGITDFSVGAGFNVKDKWYFGGSLSFPFLRYDRNATYRETDASDDPNNNFKYFEALETLQTRGVGVNGKFGVIFKPVNAFRIGLAVHTPTYYQLTDDYTSEVITDLDGYAGAGEKHQSSTDLTDGQPLESKYNLSTPWRFILSGSYLFAANAENVQNQNGFISADVEYVNYKNASFQDPNNDADANQYYHSLNTTIDGLYTNAINARLGGEMKFNTFMVRLGGAYYGNPYQNESADVVKVSGGAGYRNHGFFLDLTYVYSMTKDIHYPYRLQDKANVPAYLKTTGGNIIATIGFKL